jgi:hypothetical protein
MMLIRRSLTPIIIIIFGLLFFLILGFDLLPVAFMFVVVVPLVFGWLGL